MLEAIRATNLLNGVVSALRKHIMQQAKRCSHFIFNKVDWVGHLNSVHLCQGWNMWISEHVVGCIGDKMATEQRALFPRLKYTGIQSNGCNHMGFVTASSLFSDAACEVALMERGNLLWYISKTKVRKWRHTSVTAPQTTYNCTVSLESCSGWHHRNINALHYWLFGGKYVLTAGFPSQRPVIGEAFPFHEFSWSTAKWIKYIYIWWSYDWCGIYCSIYHCFERGSKLSRCFDLCAYEIPIQNTENLYQLRILCMQYVNYRSHRTHIIKIQYFFYRWQVFMDTRTQIILHFSRDRQLLCLPPSCTLAI